VIRRIQVASDLAADPGFSNTHAEIQVWPSDTVALCSYKLGSSLQMRSSALASIDLTLMFLTCFGK
jgi:hypothetical protein